MPKKPNLHLTWQGSQTLAAITERLVGAVNEIDQRVETGAKANLYPGHGKISGTLQRGVQAIPARIEGLRIVGGVGVKGVAYALIIHRRYEYITEAYGDIEGQALGIVERHVL